MDMINRRCCIKTAAMNGYGTSVEPRDREYDPSYKYHSSEAKGGKNSRKEAVSKIPSQADQELEQSLALSVSWLLHSLEKSQSWFEGNDGDDDNMMVMVMVRKRRKLEEKKK